VIQISFASLLALALYVLCLVIWLCDHAHCHCQGASKKNANYKLLTLDARRECEWVVEYMGMVMAMVMQLNTKSKKRTCLWFTAVIFEKVR